MDRLMLRISFIGFLCLCINIPALKAQFHYIQHYEVENGLSHNSVMCILQDKQGFMWFGTKDGLNRFDGYTFKIFRNDIKDARSQNIGSNFIKSLCETDSILWVGTDKGLYEYHPKKENFRLVAGTSDQDIRKIYADNRNNIWFIRGTTLCKYDRIRNVTNSYNTEQFFDASSICSSPNGTLWISSLLGILYRYDPSNDTFESFDLFENSRPSASKRIETIYNPGNQTILVGTQSQGVKIFDIKSLTYQDVLPQDHGDLFVRDFIKKNDHEYWIASESGIFVYNINSNDVTHLKKGYNNPYSISDNAVYALSTDKEGGIWAGTYFGGLNYFPKQYTPFKKFYPMVDENSISGNAVREICPDQYGNLWIGTEDAGLNKYDTITGLFTGYKPNGKRTGLSYYNIHALLAQGNKLWIGTFEHGLDVMDIRSGKIIRHYSADDHPGALKSNFIYSMLKTKNGNILIGSSYGLYKYQPKTDDFSLITDFPTNYHYTILLQDNKGTLWAGSYHDGLYYYNPSTGKKGYYKHDLDSGQSLSNNSINDIFEDHNDNFWIATENGLCKLNRGNNKFQVYNSSNGFPSNVIYQILEDNENQLWISTSKGLVRFDPVTEKTKVFTKAHGLLSDQFNYNSSYKDAQGRMYFGSVKGLVRFNPAEFERNNYIPPIRITGFQINNKEALISENNPPLNKSITYTENITLNYDQSSFSLDFAALSYTAPRTTEYTYKMDGLDKNWTFLPANRKVYFTELAPGDYTFKVKAANSSGIWNQKATSLNITILPPFYASTWAYIIYGFLIIFGLFMLIKFYHEQNEKRNKRKITLLENEKEKEIYQAKIEFFTNVAHEIRTPLTLITGPLEKVINTPMDNPIIKNNLEIMKKNTNRLLELANQLLDFRKTEIKQFSLTFVKVNVKELLEDIYTRFQSIIEEKKLKVEMGLPGADAYAYVDAEALTKILSNLLNNAVKYAQRMVSIKLSSFNNQDESFQITISNDGVLIPHDMREKVFEPFLRLNETEEQNGTGIGLSLARSLAELHKGQLRIDVDVQTLNCFVLTLPVHQEKEFKLYEDQIEVDVSAEEKELTARTETSLKPSILFVEDHREMIEFVSNELKTDYQLFKAHNGEEALKILNKESINLIISDIMMPVMDGLQLCEHVKTNINHSHIPIILLTSKNSLQAKITGLESGADAYIEKPFSVEHLRVQIINLLTNKNKIKQYFASTPLAHIKSMAHSKADEHFLEKLNDGIYGNIADPELNVEYLADIMNMSRPTLYRKIKAVSNLTPNELINLARLKKAAQLLLEGEYKIYEVAYMVGYNSQTSFGRNFQKQFDMTPSEFMNKKEKVDQES